MTDPVPAQWPFAMISEESKEYPALVVEWKLLDTDNAGKVWHARCLYFRDGAPRDHLIPAQRVTKVGG